jgi:hypothetical protein
MANLSIYRWYGADSYASKYRINTHTNTNTYSDSNTYTNSDGNSNGCI